MFLEIPVDTNALTGLDWFSVDPDVVNTMDCFLPLETRARPAALPGTRPEYLAEFLLFRLPGSAERTVLKPAEEL